MSEKHSVEIIDCGKINLIVEDGPRGYSAYQIAKMNGFQGSEEEWLESLVGPPVPVAQELGDDPSLAVSQKLLKDSIESMEFNNSEAVSEAEHLNSLSQRAADSAESSASSAGEAANQAADSASKAASSEAVATDKAEAATQAADSAESSASSAGEAANQAADSASKASSSEAIASDKAESAAKSADSAADSLAYVLEKTDEVELNAERVEALIKSVETQTSGRMTVRFTKGGQISYFYIIPQFNCEDIAPDGSLGVGPHPAFIFDGKVEPYILIAAYQAAMVGGEVVSQPGLDPHAGINYDQALSACRENGAGWDLMSNLDWAAVALWCMAYGNQPYGNTYYGLPHDKRFLTGIRQDKMAVGTASGAARTLTGTGGAHWNHNGLDCGIADMVGNVWEWVSGMKMVDGNVFLAAENGVTDESLYVDTGFFLPASRTWSSVDSEGASDLVKQSLIAPSSAGLAPNGRLYTNLEGERLPCRGGSWSIAGVAGLAALNLFIARSSRTTSVGFRARFRDL